MPQRALTHSLSTSQPTDTMTVATLTGEFDLASRSQLDALGESFSGCPSTLVVDLSNVTYLDSTILHALLSLEREADLAEGRLLLVRPQPTQWRVFEVSGLGPQFSWFESAAAAEAEAEQAELHGSAA